MKNKEGTENNLLKRLKNDYVFRTFFTSVLSLSITLLFTGYNFYLGVVYQTAWNFCIAVYYALLTGIKSYILLSEKAFLKPSLTVEEKENGREKLFFVASISLFIIDLALLAPISLMVLQKKDINYTKMPAIAIAAYTTYKITVSTRSYLKSKNQRHLSVRILKNINLIDALVSILSLQYTLIMTFGDGIDGDMLPICAGSSFAIWIFLIVLSVTSLVKAVKVNRNRLL